MDMERLGEKKTLKPRQRGKNNEKKEKKCVAEKKNDVDMKARVREERVNCVCLGY